MESLPSHTFVIIRSTDPKGDITMSEDAVFETIITVGKVFELSQPKKRKFTEYRETRRKQGSVDGCCRYLPRLTLLACPTLVEQCGAADVLSLHLLGRRRRFLLHSESDRCILVSHDLQSMSVTLLAKQASSAGYEYNDKYGEVSDGRGEPVQARLHEESRRKLTSAKQACDAFQLKKAHLTEQNSTKPLDPLIQSHTSKTLQLQNLTKGCTQQTVSKAFTSLNVTQMTAPIEQHTVD
ncbi:hypothetical protein BLNAU_17117 [Blattamonas nauphoetae]|uniref:Uncharacterized protein n=1 Tax=Blattamonas nauphoetae TaxID=2049346 RepID=A0ABQ9X7R5_9EUKA|nr:hypothetical protein BLNAU_17117 [Blattamonas nauphoetae]